jgi:integrase
VQEFETRRTRLRLYATPEAKVAFVERPRKRASLYDVRKDASRPEASAARNFKPLLEEAGLPRRVRFYDLRHTFATWMLEQGENPKIVQEILGHSQITHTMDTYSHVTPNIRRGAFVRLSKRLK